MSYKFYNANTFKNDISDCVVRCLSVLLDKSWRNIYNELTYLAGNEGTMFDRVDFVEDYLDKRYKRQHHRAKTVGEFAKEYPRGRYAVTMDGHITPIIDGVIIDTFDPSKRIMRCAWKIK